jgi:hypothetical protein
MTPFNYVITSHYCHYEMFFRFLWINFFLCGILRQGQVEIHLKTSSGEQVMKIAILIMLSGTLGSSALAQQGAAGPPVAVLKYEWVHIHDWDSESATPDATASGAPVIIPGDHESSRPRMRQIPLRMASPKTVFDDLEAIPRPLKDVYRYTKAIRNLAGQPIHSVVWEYVIVDLQSHAELARLRFKTAQKIPPGKTKKLTASTWTPPTHTMRVQGLRHSSGPQAGESVEIRQIQYSDGSLWTRR